MLKLNNITTSLSDGVLTATISRPKSLNALNLQTIDDLYTLATHVYDNDAIKALILTGEGEKAFVAGADIGEIAKLDEQKAKLVAEKGQNVFFMLENCPKPTIAAVNGFALGGGCELAMACHMRLATENARFGQPEVNLGIVPGYGGTQRLPQLVGKGKALELMMTGDMISAEEAKALGLVNHVVSNQLELMELCKKMLAKILTKAPLAISKVIECTNVAYANEGYQTEANAFGYCANTKDFREGTTAFLEKRRASFKGE